MLKKRKKDLHMEQFRSDCKALTLLSLEKHTPHIHTLHTHIIDPYNLATHTHPTTVHTSYLRYSWDYLRLSEIPHLSAVVRGGLYVCEPKSNYRWMAGAAIWTTSLSNGCGGRWNRRPSICMKSPTVSKQNGSAITGLDFTILSALTLRSTKGRRTRILRPSRDTKSGMNKNLVHLRQAANLS